MPGTILLDDYRDEVERQLRQHISNLTSGAQSAASAVIQPVQALGEGMVQAPQAIQTGAQQTVQNVQDALNQHIDQITQGAQQAAQQAQVTVQQAAAPVVQQLGQTRDNVEQALNAHIDTLGGATPLGATPANALGAPAQSNQPTITTLGGQTTNAPNQAVQTANVVTPQSAGPSGSIPANYNVPVDQGPTISRAQTIEALRGTPLADIAGDIWDLGVRYNVDPAFALSVAKNESAYGDPTVAPGQAQSNNVWDISGGAYGGTPGGRWGSYPTKLAGAEAFYKLITSEYYPKGQTTVGSVMWGPNGNQQHAYAPLSENSPDYPNRLVTTMSQYRDLPGGQVTTAQARSADLGYQPPKAALPHGEEPATSTDVHQGDNLASGWKTQFDFGATYTGDYRTGTPHRGVDLVPSNGKGIGTEVDAFAPGTVSNIFRDPGGAGGLIVYVQDADGLTHAYMHLDHVVPGLKVGDQVQRGTPIAAMGESGTEGSPHLHYEVRKNAGNGDPLNQLIDPRPYLQGAKQPGGAVGANAPAVTQGTALGGAAGTQQNQVINQPAEKPPPVLYLGENQPAGQQQQNQPQSLGDQIQNAIQRYVQDAVTQVTNQAQNAGGAVVNAVQAVPSNLDRDTQRLRDELGTTVRTGLSGAQEAVGNVVQAGANVAPVLGGAAEDFGRNGPIGATRGALQAGAQALGGALEPSARDEFARNVEAAGNQAADTVSALGIGPPGAAEAVRLGTQIVAGQIGQPSQAEAMQTVTQLTNKYPLDKTGVLPNLDAMSDEDRQKYLQAMLIIGSVAGAVHVQGGAAAAVARGAPRDVLQGMAVPRAGYEVGTPEHTVETALQDAARAQGTATPQIDQATIQSFPGMADSRLRGLSEVRDAVEAGLPAARWYQEVVQQIKQDTGQTINPREAAVLMGAFGGNAGVPPNYHAMLSVFDAMRQVKPDLVGLENLDYRPATKGGVGAIQATQAFQDVAARVHADKAYIDDDMLARVMRGYRTGEVPVPSGAKLSSYTQDFLHALSESYSPFSTQDVWQGRLFGGRPQVQASNNALVNIGSNDATYRTTHALTNWVAREFNIPPDQAQAAGWTVYRMLSNDKTIGPLLNSDQIGLGDAIRMGKQSGLLDPRTIASGGMAEINAPRGSGAWADKINDLRDRIRSNGSYDQPPPPSATAVNEMGLYHPSIQSAAQQRSILGPGGEQYGTVAGPKVGISRPVGNEPAARLRDLALGDQPVLRVGDVETDARGKIPWLLPEHDVQRTNGGTYVTVAGVGEDGARLIGERLGADRINHADPVAQSVGGVGIDGLSRADQARLADAFQAQGLPVLRETSGTGLRVPLVDGTAADLARTVKATLARESVSGTLTNYKGATYDTGAGAGGARGVGSAGGAVGPLGLSARDRLRASLFRDAATELGTTGTVRPERDILPGAVNAGGGRADTPAGFRAPVTPDDLNVRSVSPEEARQLVGGAYDPSGRVTERGGLPRSNPYGLREPRAGETPMTDEELAAHGDMLEQRYQAAQNRLDAVQEMIASPGQKVERPPWAVGYTGEQVAAMAKQVGRSPFEPLWWEKAGLESGSGEVRELLNENSGGAAMERGRGTRDATPAELRQERTRLQQELQDVQAAYDQVGNAPAGAQFVRDVPDTPAAGPDELPFDTGAPTEEPAPVTEAMGGRDEGSRLAQEIVLSKGRGTIRQGEGEISATKGGVTGRAILEGDAVRRATETAPTQRTLENMPNLEAMLKDMESSDMAPIAAQIRKAAEDNPDLFEAYRQGRISFDSVKHDLATRVGMSDKDWLKTEIGKGFNQNEMAALQAAAVEAQGRLQAMGDEILAKPNGVDSLSDSQLAHATAELTDAARLLAVARGGRATAGRTLNILKQRFDRGLASDIAASNERLAASKAAAEARKAATKATTVLRRGRALETEATTAKASAARRGASRDILREIDQAYAELDRYNAMTLHEKASVQDALKAERDKRAAARKAAVRSAPEELLSALRQELRAEQDNFAKRRDNWETQAFWDSKQFENAMAKRTAFRGQLYIEQQRKVANIAAKQAERDQTRAFDQELQRRKNQQARAEKLLESMGGKEPTRELLRQFLIAQADPNPLTAAKFIKGMTSQNNWMRANIVRLAGLVSAPITNMVNIGGNTAGAMVEGLAVRPTVVLIDAVRAGITGGERQAYRAELLPAMQAYGPGFLGKLGDAAEIMRSGVRPEDTVNLRRIRPGFEMYQTGLGRRIGAGASATVDTAVEVPLRLLGAMDTLFRGGSAAYHGNRVAMRQAIREGFRGDAAKGRAATIAGNLEDYPELAREVADAAARDVFQERRTFPGLSKLPETNQAAQFAVSQVLPFTKTPANITAQGAAMSPLGFAGVAEALRGVGREGQTSAQRGRQVLLAEERLARTMIGTGIMGAGLALGSAGMLTASYPSDPKEASTLPQGWRPWSMRLSDPVSGNTYYVPLQNMGHMGFPLAMAAIATDPVHKGKTILDPDQQLGAAASIGKYVIDNTFLQGISDFVDLLNDPRTNASKFLEPAVSSFMPYSSASRELQRAFGVATRNPREGIRGLGDAMEAVYPGLSGLVPPSTTPLGEERTQGATGLGRLVPFRYDIERDDPRLKVLRENGVGIPPTPKQIGLNGGSIELTEDERRAYQAVRAKAIGDVLSQLQNDRSFQNAPQATKSLQLQRAMQIATRSANGEFLTKNLGQAAVTSRWQAKPAPEPYDLGAQEAS